MNKTIYYHLLHTQLDEVFDYPMNLKKSILLDRQDILDGIVEVTDTMIQKGCVGYFWLICAPQLARIFERLPSFKESEIDQFHQGKSDIQYSGIIDRRWKLYVAPQWNDNRILVGCHILTADDKDRFAAITVQ